jgi:hypothetical protein
MAREIEMRCGSAAWALSRLIVRERISESRIYHMDRQPSVSQGRVANDRSQSSSLSQCVRYVSREKKSSCTPERTFSPSTKGSLWKVLTARGTQDASLAKLILMFSKCRDGFFCSDARAWTDLDKWNRKWSLYIASILHAAMDSLLSVWT